jgi:hypothetical protein
MPKRRTYIVVDSRGALHKRTTEARNYSHAVIAHHREYVSKWDGKTYGASSYSQWCGSRALAERAAQQARRHDHCEGVEIIEVQQ